MTEKEWLAATDPTPMLAFLNGKASDRKMRLFAVACCRRIWHLIQHAESQQAVALSEQYADGISCEAEMQAAGESAFLRAEAALNDWSEAITAAQQQINTRKRLTQKAADKFWLAFRERAKANLNGSTYYAVSHAADLRIDAEDVSRESADAAVG